MSETSDIQHSSVPMTIESQETTDTTATESIDLIKDTRPRVVALLDLDGTLSVPFTLTRWIKYLDKEGIGHKKVRDELLAAIEAYDKGKFFIDSQKREKGTYFDFIKHTGDLYVQTLSGHRAQDIRAMGADWSIQKDTLPHLKPYSIAVVKLLKSLGIEPTLVTGTPIEAIEGFRRHLGIRDRCYGLEPKVDANGLYVGDDPKHNTGLPKEKAGIVYKIAKRAGHQVIFSMGDQRSDGPLIKGALEKQRGNPNDLYGASAIIIGPSGDVVWEEYESYHADAIRDTRLIGVNPGKVSRKTLLKNVLDLLAEAITDPANRGLPNVDALSQKLSDVYTSKMLEGEEIEDL